MPMTENTDCKCIDRVIIDVRTKEGITIAQLGENDQLRFEGQTCGEIMCVCDNYRHGRNDDGDYQAEIDLPGPISLEETPYAIVKQLTQQVEKSLREALSGTVINVRFPIRTYSREGVLVPQGTDPLIGIMIYKNQRLPSQVRSYISEDTGFVLD